MSLVVEATFEKGAFKLAQPVALPEGAQVRLTITPIDEDYDPLDAVIGICDDGPEISLAARHDELIYGLKARGEPQR
jgi:predicted DNA-binding antitoxin AbrB/MazE fold protein